MLILVAVYDLIPVWVHCETPGPGSKRGNPLRDPWSGEDVAFWIPSACCTARKYNPDSTSYGAFRILKQQVGSNSILKVLERSLVSSSSTPANEELRNLEL
ncbi:hypothetical protein VNO77_44796 [Canavalia gladiata]|uniref:Uncharacterized protein n=1 Tax=Canavalia gladiata TaxID=3824 RepID=A0AAN9JYR2_CANGL